MSAPRRVLRFRTAGNAGFAVPQARTLIDLFLNDETVPTGHIVRLDPEPGTPERWAYVLADGRATGLQSTLSRQDLEGSIMEHYFHDLTADARRSA
jgi:hypothetical protein